MAIYVKRELREAFGQEIAELLKATDNDRTFVSTFDLLEECKTNPENYPILVSLGDRHRKSCLSRALAEMGYTVASSQQVKRKTECRAFWKPVQIIA
jgi:hypothetical protein